MNNTPQQLAESRAAYERWWDSYYNGDNATFAPDDRFLMYTDGMAEALNSGQEMYSDERLAHRLGWRRPENVTNLVQGLVVDVLFLMGRADQSDDVTVFALEYRGDGALK